MYIITFYLEPVEFVYHIQNREESNLLISFFHDDGYHFLREKNLWAESEARSGTLNPGLAMKECFLGKFSLFRHMNSGVLPCLWA